jgi:hypothetical protein
MSNKTIELARKIKALAEQSEGGEHESAIKMLAVIMNKHKITIADLEITKPKAFTFEVEKQYTELFAQVALSELGEYKYKVAKNSILISLTYEQSVLIQAKYDFFLAAYQKELKLFFYAFATKNNLYSKTAKVKYVTSKEDIEKVRAIEKMSKVICKSEFHKQIT